MVVFLGLESIRSMPASSLTSIFSILPSIHALHSLLIFPLLLLQHHCLVLRIINISSWNMKLLLLLHIRWWVKYYLFIRRHHHLHLWITLVHWNHTLCTAKLTLHKESLGLSWHLLWRHDKISHPSASHTTHLSKLLLV